MPLRPHVRARALPHLPGRQHLVPLRADAHRPAFVRRRRVVRRDGRVQPLRLRRAQGRPEPAARLLSGRRRLLGQRRRALRVRLRAERQRRALRHRRVRKPLRKLHGRHRPLLLGRRVRGGRDAGVARARVPAPARAPGRRRQRARRAALDPGAARVSKLGRTRARRRVRGLARRAGVGAPLFERARAARARERRAFRLVRRRHARGARGARRRARLFGRTAAARRLACLRLRARAPRRGARGVRRRPPRREHAAAARAPVLPGHDVHAGAVQAGPGAAPLLRPARPVAQPEHA